MRVHHLSCGTMRPVGGGTLLAPSRMVCHCLLIETEADGLIVVDSGFGNTECRSPESLPRTFRAATRPALDTAETVVEQVRMLGLDPADVRHLILTHLDLDHAGGVPDFPSATLHVHELEREAAMTRPTMRDRHRYRPAQFRDHEHWETYSDEGDSIGGLRAVRPLRGVAADVALVPLFGHSRGHTGVAVATSDGWLLHAGDAYFHTGELRGAQVPVGLSLFTSAVAWNNGQRRDNLRRLRELADDPQFQIFSAHDATELERLRRDE